MARELQALDAAGIPYHRLESDFEQGILSLKVTLTVNGETHALIATFPDLYPYFRFEVRALDLDLAHHQNRFSKALCLIDRSTTNWLISDTLAEFLLERLPKVLHAAAATPHEAAALEEHQGEPISNYFQYSAAMCLVDSDWDIPTQYQDGELLLGVLNLALLSKDEPPALTAAVLEVRGNRGEVICRAAAEVVEAYKGQQFRGRWSRWPNPMEGATDDVRDHARNVWKATRDRDAHNSDQAPYRQKDTAGNQATFSVRGLLITEETKYQQTGPGWVFVVRIKIEPPEAQPGKHKHKQRPVEHFHFARSGRAGPQDLSARAQELAPLQSRRIAQVGLGCLGGISAMEFARAGIGRIRAIDPDIVEPGTVLRWPLGLVAAGRFKAEALLAHLAKHYPRTVFEPRARQLGGSRGTGMPSDDEVLDWLLEGADLVYDASAEIGVQWLLGAYALQRRLPYLRVAATAGAWGGYVLRIRPGITPGCYWCFHEATTEGQFLAPERSDGRIRPVGCASPTYIGAGFELAQVALQGVRLAVGTLCEGVDGAFPCPDWDVAVITLRGGQGEFAVPQVTTHVLDRRPNCQVCGESA